MASMCLVHAPYMHSSSKFHFTLLCLRKCLGETHITKMQLSEEPLVLLQAGYQGYRLLRKFSYRYTTSDNFAIYLLQDTLANSIHRESCICRPTRVARVHGKPWQYKRTAHDSKWPRGERECGLRGSQPRTEVVRQDIHLHPAACKGCFAVQECHGPKSFLSPISNGVLQLASTGELRKLSSSMVSVCWCIPRIPRSLCYSDG
ncbi:hypothetical protein HDV63DRAFT_9158 [Trichoderma sp. SZMC 28014]